MAHMNSTNHLLSREEQKTLLAIARQSIVDGLSSGVPLPVRSSDFPDNLREERASFVTLNMHEQLRGCIGSLEAIRPIVEDISENSFAAAFRDSRFSPVTTDEMENIDIHISILTTPQPVEFTCEQDLLSKILPGIDGLILIDGLHRGTFLPAVWKSLPDSKDFLDQLKLKAGLAKNYWSDQIQILRYQTESFGERD
jgi:AmmeMemoRadiSam system protein A